MNGKRFSQDFSQVPNVEKSDKLMIERSATNTVGFATVEQLSNVLGGGGSVEPDFFQAPRLNVERIAPDVFSVEDVKRYGKNPTITITHPYYEAHPDKCFFVLMKRTRAMRRHSNVSGASYTSKKKWNFFKGTLCNLDVSQEYPYRSLPVKVPEEIGAQELLTMFLERGVLRLHHNNIIQSDHMAFVLDQNRNANTPVWDTFLGYTTLGNMQPTEVYFGNLAYRPRRSLTVGIALVMENPNFQGISDYQNWSGGGYRWLVSEVVPFKLVAGSVERGNLAGISI